MFRKIIKGIFGIAAAALVLVLLVSAIAYALLDEALLKRELSKALGRDVTFSRL